MKDQRFHPPRTTKTRGPRWCGELPRHLIGSGWLACCFQERRPVVVKANLTGGVLGFLRQRSHLHGPLSVLFLDAEFASRSSYSALRTMTPTVFPATFIRDNLSVLKPLSDLDPPRDLFVALHQPLQRI